MKNNILTAEEFLLSKTKCKNLNEVTNMMKKTWKDDADGILVIMKEFARLHVAGALKTAAKKAIEMNQRENEKISKNAIIKSYDLNNIK